MGCRPKVHRKELEAAIARIAARRAKVDDPNRERLPDAPDSNPRDVLLYLQRFSSNAIPRWVLQADVSDALTLTNWLWWEDRRLELHFLQQGRTQGLFLDQLGRQVGVGKQGVRDRIDRLTALLRYDRPDEKLARADRAARRAAMTRAGAECEWLDNNDITLRAAMTDLVHQADTFGLHGEEREWLDEVGVELAKDRLEPTVIPLLSLAAAELRTAPAVAGLPPTHSPGPVHRVLARVDGLRAAFAAL